jgi:hypothetical protein
MSFFASFTKKSKLDAAVKKAEKARKSESSIADQLLKEVYQDYADVLTGDPLRAETLYRWGVTLLHQAKSKTAPESINIYRNAIAKFSFCMTIDPSYLAAAIDAGVACMDLARARKVPTSDELYEMAKKQFEKANSIQAGVAAYNLACIHGLLGDNEGCLATLKIAKDNGNLPDAADVFADPDMDTVKNQPWFKEFFESIEEEKRLAEEKKIADALAIEAEAKRQKEAKDAAYDPYKPLKNNKQETKTEAEVTEEKPKKLSKKDSKTEASEES